MQPTPETIYAAMEATWPPAARERLGPWTLRDGQGGGSRVSAATAEGPVSERDIHAAVEAMQMRGQRPLFAIRPGEEMLDEILDASGYALFDPVTFFAAPVGALSLLSLPRAAAFTIWEPLAIMLDIWGEGGVDAARVAVMERAPWPKAAIFGRSGDTPAGAAFVALHGDLAMIHAVEVRQASRRQGTARHMLIEAGRWAEAQGAQTVGLAVRTQNAPAVALYTALGMAPVAGYHYRKAPAVQNGRIAGA
ncbi:GNAT family N-acetyltransferase [Mesobaculum littorinae]|uniref:GNAT family N-acetyltransferase n=1 Tax=Mesobaculum littorinae TaxID=2486419 RepID=A0A438AH45_9RHOB|nr:GNAT family N-acetyltransferase [Mesobaculum littorinae]RVV98043.1 GNAT family N-acetyltransferase [Mesobaculum littorinae]